MTIRRQYSLPSCTLILEGWSDETASQGQGEGRPLMSILVNAECHFADTGRSLAGEREFLESLVKAVSAYAQQFLSGIARLQQGNADLIRLEQGKEKGSHHLIENASSSSTAKQVQLQLTTVQLFDLVDAVDQFLADTRTLPEFSLQLQPAPRRYRQPEEPMVKRAAPAALGATSLAAAAIAFYLLPIPEVRKPQPTRQEPNSSESSSSSTASSGNPPRASHVSNSLPENQQQPNPIEQASNYVQPTPSSPASTSESSANFNSSPENQQQPHPTEQASNYIQSTPGDAASKPPSASSPNSTTSTSVERSPQQVVRDYYSALNRGQYQSAWKQLPPELRSDQEVHPDGYLTYKNWFEKVDAIDIQETKLVQTSSETAKVDVRLQYQMKNGRLVPLGLRYSLVRNAATGNWVFDAIWERKGRQTGSNSSSEQSSEINSNISKEQSSETNSNISKEQSSETKSSSSAESSSVSSQSPNSFSPQKLEKALASASQVSDSTELHFLQRSLRNDINNAWKNRDQVNENLEYRVWVTRDGAIVGYKPVEEIPAHTDSQLPLPELRYSLTQAEAKNQEKIAQFRVIFTKGGVVQVSPWQGYADQPTFGSEIFDSGQLKELKSQLHQQLLKARVERSFYSKKLVYRVGITQDGAIADYEPQNQPAFDYVDQTPLPHVVKPAAAGMGSGGSVVPQEPLAQFKVVFKPRGGLKVTRFR
ncbi:MAG: hypothetical protein BRC48_13405 [Cyanobacteria bacterium QS_9_48_30]|nr:MAG: hypothetical protein BRC48_13405 [Cyanobacteria bacterium QS_9_48_30]